MKKLLSSLALLVALVSSLAFGQTLNPIGIDISTGQQKVNTGVQIGSSASGTFVDTGTVQTITGQKTFNTATHIFSGADSLRIPTSAPASTSGNIGLASGILQIGDGTAAREYLRLDNTQTITGAKTFSGANTLVIPDNDPSVDRGIGYQNNTLKMHDGTSAHIYVPLDFSQQGLYNICFLQGADSSQLKISSCSAGAALSATNFGAVRMRSSTAGTYRTFTVSADVTLDLTGAHWGVDTKGNTTGSILRVYAIDDAGTLRWGVGYQGGFYYIRNTQDNTTASSNDLPEEIYSDGNVATDNSPMRDVGYIIAGYTDASNDWAITEYHPNESADGIWQPWAVVPSGFSSPPTAGAGRQWTQVGRLITIKSDSNGSGTSNSTDFAFAVPIKTSNSSDAFGIIANSTDNSVLLTAPSTITWTSASSIRLGKTIGGGVNNWTASGSKDAEFTYQYEAIQP